jgi:hypothetical protein
LSADNTRLAPRVRSAKCLDNITVYSNNTAIFIIEKRCVAVACLLCSIFSVVAGAGEPVVVTVTGKAKNIAE